MISKTINEVQSTKVDEIISLINRRIKDDDQKILTFKSPTGSGKTYMMLKLMNKIVKSNKRIIFIVSSLSMNNLAAQTFNVFRKNIHNFPYLKIGSNVIGSNVTSFMYIEPNSNIYVLPVDKYKKDSLLKDGPNGDILNDFLNNMKMSNKKIYLIKDESHRATKNLEKLESYFDFILNFSATPKHHPDIELTIRECEEIKLIKHINKYSKVLNDYGISEYKKIKKKYVQHKIPCNPALIIQISNSKNGESECKKIKKFLPQIDSMQQYTEDTNLQWVIIGDKTNKKINQTNNKDLLKLPKEEWTKELAKPLCPISIIIFKLIIKEGYDIPRACMLYQVRDTKSKILDEQTIGRICRNPILKDFDQYPKDTQKLVLLAKAWGIFDKNDNYKIDLVLKKNEKFKIKLKTTKIENKWLTKGWIDCFNSKNVLNNQIKNDKSIFELNKKWEKIIGNNDDITMIKNQIKSNEQWFFVMNNLESIKNENEKYVKNYEKSIVVDKNKHGFLEQTYCWNQQNNVIINDDVNNNCYWPYNRKDTTNREFPLESRAEKDFFDDVAMYFNYSHNPNDIKIFGKNFYLSNHNNAIKYGYVNNGIRTTYPDFIIQIKNIFYIIEIKSNVKMGRFDQEQEKKYHQKYEAIIEAYKATSKKIPQYVFAVVIKEDKKDENVWTIHKSINGKQTKMEHTTISNLFDSHN